MELSHHITLKKHLAYMLKIGKWLFFPGVLIGSLFGALITSDYLPMSYLPFIPILFSSIFLAIILVFEWALPYRQEWNKTKGDAVTDIIQTFLALPISSKLTEFGLLFLLVYPSTKLNDLIGFSAWSSNLNVLVQLALVVVIAEFFFYWFHRLMHQSSKLWKLHAVHHGCERLYSINSGRFHVLENVIGTLFYFIPIILLQVPDLVLMLFFVITIMSGFLEHANVDYKTGPFKYLFNTAELHRWHHSINEEQSDNNYGKVLIIWDLVFGTYYLPKNKEVGTIGIDDTAKMPNSFMGQLKYPFKK
jgi:ornithine lipid hydroxylase